jgi:hypothetical protein
MKRFLIQVICAAALFFVLDLLVIVCRVALAQRAVDEAFDIPPGTEVVFIGNSHTGCAWTEAPEFRNRKAWYHAMGFVVHYLRFLELERRGAFDKGVRACVVDCDMTAFDGFTKKNLAENFRNNLSFAWRHVDKVPEPASVIVDVLCHASAAYFLNGEAPPEAPDWTTWTPERQIEIMKHFYGENWWQTSEDDSPELVRDWQTRFFEMVADMKARCNRHGVRLIFLATPLASNDPGRANAVVSNRVSAVAEKIRSMGIEYYDYRAACPDNKFRDAGHLLRSASYEFTKTFYAEVLKQTVGSDTR